MISNHGPSVDPPKPGFGERFTASEEIRRRRTTLSGCIGILEVVRLASRHQDLLPLVIDDTG